MTTVKAKSAILPAWNDRLQAYTVQVLLDRPEAEKLERLRLVRGQRSWGKTLRTLLQEAK